MPRIIVQRNNQTYKEFLLRPFKTCVTIGSHGDNDLILADSEIRAHHFIIRRKNQGYFLEPADGATNVLVNGKEVSAPTKIKTGDVIEIGSHQLLFENEIHDAIAKQSDALREGGDVPTKAKEKSAPEANEDANDEFDEMTDEEINQLSIEKPELINDYDAKKTEPHFLVAIHGPYLGNIYQLNEVTTKIGRDNLLNDIIIDRTPDGKTDTSISRRHATIVHSEGYYYILDKRSKTRTRVNKRKLNEDEVFQLYPNDEIEIVSDRESTIFRFCPKSKLNFARPRKAGTWWLRNRHRLGWFVSLVSIAILSLVIVHFANLLSIVQEKPDELKVSNATFYKLNESSGFGLNFSESDGQKPIFSLAAADVNGDDFVDILFFDRSGYLGIVDGRTKRDLWERTTRVRGMENSGIVLTDLNEDGLADVVVTGYNTIISAFEGKTGMEFWSSPILGGSLVGTPIVGNFSGDSYQDLFVLSREGKIHTGIGNYGEPDWKVFDLKAGISVPPLAKDIDSDGLTELVFADMTGKIFMAEIVQDSLSIKLIADPVQFDETQADPKLKSFFVVEVEAEKPIILCQTESNQILVIDVATGREINVFHLTEEFDPEQTTIALSKDFSGRELTRLFVADSSRIYCYFVTEVMKNGNPDAIWNIHIPGGKFLNRQMVVADVDKDRIQDLIIPLLPAGIGIISGKNGNLTTSFLTKARDEARPLGTPVVADFGNDTYVDILQRMSDNRFQIFSTNCRIPQGSVLWGQPDGNRIEQNEEGIEHRAEWFFPAAILMASLLIFAIFAVNFIIIERRKSLFPKKIAEASV